MNLTFVRSFVALAESESFQAAAKRLDIAPSTLSQHLKKLEDALGAQLVVRQRLQSELTRQGRVALPIARQVVETADRLVHRVRREGLTVSASGNIANYFLGPALQRFSELEGGNLDWELVPSTNPGALDLLRQGEVDLAVTEWKPEIRGLVSSAWHREEMIVIGAPGSYLSGKTELTREEFLDLPMIGGEPGSGTGTLLKDLLGESARRLRTLANLGSTEAVKSAVSAGLGYSIVLTSAVASDVATGRLTSARVEGTAPSKTFYVTRNAEERFSPRADRFIDVLKSTPCGSEGVDQRPLDQ